MFLGTGKKFKEVYIPEPDFVWKKVNGEEILFSKAPFKVPYPILQENIWDDSTHVYIESENPKKYFLITERNKDEIKVEGIDKYFKKDEVKFTIFLNLIIDYGSQNYKHKTMEIKPCESIKNLKQRLIDEEDSEEDIAVMIIYKDKILSNEDTLYNLNVKLDETLHVKIQNLYLHTFKRFPNTQGLETRHYNKDENDGIMFLSKIRGFLCGFGMNKSNKMKGKITVKIFLNAKEVNSSEIRFDENEKQKIVKTILPEPIVIDKGNTIRIFAHFDEVLDFLLYRSVNDFDYSYFSDKSFDAIDDYYISENHNSNLVYGLFPEIYYSSVED